MEEQAGRRFGLTPVGECLRSDADEAVGGWAAFIGRRSHWRAWGELHYGVRTGERAVLYDWADEEALAILRRCREVMRADATLLVIEREPGPPNELPGPKLSDLNMLVGPGGRERAIDEYAELMGRAGFRFVGSASGAFDLHVLEGRPA